jgi:hypothetical protein
MAMTLRRSAPMLACALVLGACGSRGITLDDIAKDTSIITGSVSSSDKPKDDAEISDAVTIRNVVSALDLDAGAPSMLAWANAETGSRGALSSIREHSESGTLCRRFEATRESFDGVALYQGESCLASGGIWAMTAFDRL